MDYQEFLSSKNITYNEVGFDTPYPINSLLFDFQKDIVLWSLRKGKSAIFAGTGLGKALASDTLVITPTGYKKISEILVGDYVIGSDGHKTKVLGVFFQGVRPAYRIVFSDKSSVVCDENHLWTVRTKKKNHVWVTKSLKEIKDIGLGGAGDNRWARWFIPQIKPVEFDEHDLPLHPYVLGVLLGDGCVTQKAISISSADPELIEKVKSFLPIGYTLEKKRYSKYDYMVVREGAKAGRQGGHLKNQVVEILQELNLHGCNSANKFIPDCYKFSNIDTRTWLLQGLLDTDGGCWESHNCSVIEYCTVSKQLAEDFLFLVQSLGGKGNIATKHTNRRLAYRIHPSFPVGVIPFSLTRKAINWKDRIKYPPIRSIRSIEKVEDTEMICIKVEADDGLFAVNDFILTHNTLMQLEWANHVHQYTQKPILILAPLAVSQQTVREGQKLNLMVNLCRTQKDVINGINITNYEMLHQFNPDSFIAIVLDESSILKSFEGKVRTEIINKFRKTPYKLACTATPSPNDYMELGNHTEFLGVMTRTEMLSMFFVHDGGNVSQWRVKGHAQQDFWKWIASWSVMLSHPRDLGYTTQGFDLPPLDIHEIVADKSNTIVHEASTLDERRQAKRESLPQRIKKASEIANSFNGNSVLIWCNLNDESSSLKKEIHQSVEIKGSDSNEHKTNTMIGFTNGTVPKIVSKPSICGFGMNFQVCNKMIFVGLSDSFEQYYQAVRRCWRFGQTKPVDVFIVTSEKEGAIVSNIKRKERDFEIMLREMITSTQELTKKNIRQTHRETDEYNPQIQMIKPGWLKAND